MDDEREMSYREKWEKEYQRRLRYRKVILARIVVGAVGLLLLVLLIIGAGKLVKLVGKRQQEGSVAEASKSRKETENLYDNVYVPEGYETYFQQLKELQKEYKEVDVILRNLAEYPEEYLEMLLENPETLDYVKDYPEHKHDTKEGKITEEVVKGEIPLLNQWDGRWGYLSYGDSKLAWNGCGPTALSMVVIGLTGDTSYTPKTIAEFSEKNGYYEKDTGTVWGLMSQGAAEFGLNITNVPLSEDAIIRELEEKKPIICSMMPGDFTDYGHFIVLTGLDEEGNVLVNDPNSIARSEKAWKLDAIVSQIKGLWSYSLAST